MKRIIAMKKSVIRLLDASAPWLGLLAVRVLMGWEYLEAGLEKFHGENWFDSIQGKFPFPFNEVPPAISWQMATWFEIVGGAALIIGLGTRFFSLSLIILTLVATAAVHWPAEWGSFTVLMKGYVISDAGFGNFKLPVLYLAMLTALLLFGPGKLSLDALLRRKFMGR
ncbi:MAG TPA: DoxX family protein [Arenimonas sp.]|nr:DoxX family protein [Arenimonas sp.]